VSTPSTVSPGRCSATAAAFRYAFSIASSCGGPSLAQLLDVGHDHLEGDAELLQDGAALRGL
jgi:hypothetical protein